MSQLSASYTFECLINELTYSCSRPDVEDVVNPLRLQGRAVQLVPRGHDHHRVREV